MRNFIIGRTSLIYKFTYMQDVVTMDMINIIHKYDQPLTRLARRIIVHKDRADDAVKWAMESIFDEEKFFSGPHLRALLIKRTIEMAQGFNKALEVYERNSKN